MQDHRVDRGTLSLPFHSIRHISCPEDLRENRKVYAGHLPAQASVQIPTDENVRDYLVDAPGKKRKKKTNVHRAILDTLENYPDSFSILNGGLVIVCRTCEIDEKNRQLRLQSPSIINGSQTQGVLRDFFEDTEQEDEGPPSIHVSFELIVCDDEDLIADISIARNYQNDVKMLSIAGRKGQLDDLQEVMSKHNEEWKIKKKESERGDEFLDTEKLIQVLTAIAPTALIGERDRSYAYNQRARCLKEYQRVQEAASADRTAKEAKLYDFYLDIAPAAWLLYRKWKSHNGFKGSGLQALKRDARGNILEVPDGIVFPIVASYAEFCMQVDGRWSIRPPSEFEEDELIQPAKSAYIQIAKSKPHLMGKAPACYTQLQQITAIYKKLAH